MVGSWSKRSEATGPDQREGRTYANSLRAFACVPPAGGLRPATLAAGHPPGVLHGLRPTPPGEPGSVRIPPGVKGPLRPDPHPFGARQAPPGCAPLRLPVWPLTPSRLQTANSQALVGAPKPCTTPVIHHPPRHAPGGWGLAPSEPRRGVAEAGSAGRATSVQPAAAIQARHADQDAGRALRTPQTALRAIKTPASPRDQLVPPGAFWGPSSPLRGPRSAVPKGPPRGPFSAPDGGLDLSPITDTEEREWFS